MRSKFIDVIVITLLFVIAVTSVVILLMSSCKAATGQGQMSATIIDPYAMSDLEIVQFCEREPQVRRCQEIEEQSRIEEEADFIFYDELGEELNDIEPSIGEDGSVNFE